MPVLNRFRGGIRGEPLIPVLLCSGERLSLAETPPSWALLCPLGCGLAAIGGLLPRASGKAHILDGWLRP